MLKIVGAGAVALLVAGSPPVYAQAPSAGGQSSYAGGAERITPADLNALTDARVAIVKAALQLTPDQEKFWPAVENAIRSRAQNRQAHIANVAARINELRDNPIETLRDRNPVDFLHRRAESLSQRAADLNKLADSWQPLYQTLAPDQKRRMAFLTIVALREMRNAAEERRLQSEEDDE